MPPPTDAPGARRTITMYANGFTVDDGPFRTLEDPANEPFLRDLARGYVTKGGCESHFIDRVFRPDTACDT